MPMIDMTGQRLGMLIVVSRADNAPDGKARWLCRCDCGGNTVTSGGNLRHRGGQSCGCMKVKAVIERTRTHGASETKEFSTWLSMINRCHLTTSCHYHKYGARGISVCERWRASFSSFLSDMGPRPTPSHSIERRDNDGNYEPDNCYWATVLEQANNKRTTIRVNYRGTVMPFMNAMRLAGSEIPLGTVKSRIQLGWDFERAITQPARVTKAEAIADLMAQIDEREDA